MATRAAKRVASTARALTFRSLERDITQQRVLALALSGGCRWVPPWPLMETQVEPNEGQLAISPATKQPKGLKWSWKRMGLPRKYWRATARPSRRKRKGRGVDLEGVKMSTPDELRALPSSTTDIVGWDSNRRKYNDPMTTEQKIELLVDPNKEPEPRFENVLPPPPTSWEKPVSNDMSPESASVKNQGPFVAYEHFARTRGVTAPQSDEHKVYQKMVEYYQRWFTDFFQHPCYVWTSLATSETGTPPLMNSSSIANWVNQNMLAGPGWNHHSIPKLRLILRGQLGSVMPVYYEGKPQLMECNSIAVQVRGKLVIGTRQTQKFKFIVGKRMKSRARGTYKDFMMLEGMGNYAHMGIKVWCQFEPFQNRSPDDLLPQEKFDPSLGGSMGVRI